MLEAHLTPRARKKITQAWYILIPLFWYYVINLLLHWSKKVCKLITSTHTAWENFMQFWSERKSWCNSDKKEIKYLCLPAGIFSIEDYLKQRIQIPNFWFQDILTLSLILSCYILNFLFMFLWKFNGVFQPIPSSRCFNSIQGIWYEYVMLIGYVLFKCTNYLDSVYRSVHLYIVSTWVYTYLYPGDLRSLSFCGPPLIYFCLQMD